MPFHRVVIVDDIEVYHEQPCSCGTGDICNCGSGYWTTEQRCDILWLWFDYGEPSIGWQPTYSRGYPVPDKVPRFPKYS